jgi:transcriptional regulator with XRE-family HTH domain
MAIIALIGNTCQGDYLMGSKAEQPKKLADKLRRIREKLRLSQAGMADAIERHGVKTQRGSIGSFEIGARVPSLLVLLAYAKLARVSTDVLIDDERDLPKSF